MVCCYIRTTESLNLERAEVRGKDQGPIVRVLLLHCCCCCFEYGHAFGFAKFFGFIQRRFAITTHCRKRCAFVDQHATCRSTVVVSSIMQCCPAITIRIRQIGLCSDKHADASFVSICSSFDQGIHVSLLAMKTRTRYVGLFVW